jgi:hypothetical protein
MLGYCPARTIDWWDFEFDRMDVPALSTAGTPYRRSVAVGMPRIPPEVLHSTFYLYPTVEAAKAGDKFGGSGFFVAYPTGIPDAPSLIYAVTNWHVAVRDGFSVMRVNTHHGGVDIFDLDPSEWEFVPGGPDLAVLPHRKMGLRESIHRIVPLRLEMLLTRTEAVSLEINPGEDIFMIGRFVDHDGAASNVPSARFGNISVMPQEILQPTGGRFESFILDMHSRTGYSGSPVFVYRTFGSDLTTGSIHLQQMDILGSAMTSPFDHFVMLLGLHWGQFPEQWEIKTKKKSKRYAESLLDQANERYIEGMSGMTLAIPGWTIRDFLDMPKMVEEREEAVSELLALRDKHRGPVAESASPPANGENPTHREDFTRLVGAAARKQEPED